VIADTLPGQFDGHGRRRDAPVIPISLVSPGDLPQVLTLAPAFHVETATNDVETYLFRSRGRQMLALQQGAAGETPETITVDLHGWHARDILTSHDYGRPERLVLTLDPITPTFLELAR